MFPVHKHLKTAAAVVGVLLFFGGSAAWAAAGGGGGGLPWDTPLQTLEQDLTGPTAFALALAGFVLVMGILIFGGELGYWGRSLCFLILTASVLTGVVNGAAALGIVGATIDDPEAFQLYSFVLGVAITVVLFWFALILHRRIRRYRQTKATVGDGVKLAGAA